jgi:hypothetical protein
MVPNREINVQWQTCFRSALMLRGSELLKKKPHPASQSLKDIFVAYQKKDAVKFNRQLTEYLKWAERNGIAKSPFSYVLPKTWREGGVRLGKGDTMFDTVIARGEVAAKFEVGDKKQRIQGFVRHFTGETMPDTQIYNDFRIAFGLMPLSKSELAKTGVPITISGYKLFYIDLSPANQIKTSLKRIVATVVRHEGHTFFITAGLPEKVTHHLRTFESFARSLKLGSGKELSRWFPDSQPHKRYGFQTTTVAIIRDGKQLWSFRLEERPVKGKESAEQKLFEKLIRSVRPRSGNFIADLEWTDPENWQHQQPVDHPIVYLPTDQKTYARITIHNIGNAKNADTLPLVNLWRLQSALPAWQRKQMQQASQKIKVAGKTVTLIKFETRPTPVPVVKFTQGPYEKSGLKAPMTEFTYQVPKGWSVAKIGAFRKAAFVVSQGNQHANVTVLRLNSIPEALVLNVNRWRKQLKLAPLDKAAIQKAVKKITVAGKTGQYIDLGGATGLRILAVITDRKDGSWYFVIKGNVQFVEKQKAAFEAFVKSVKFK